MKVLDKSKKYDLTHLNDEQLNSVLKYLQHNDINWYKFTIENLRSKPFLCYDYYEWNQYLGSNATNAIELFN